MPNRKTAKNTFRTASDRITPSIFRLARAEARSLGSQTLAMEKRTRTTFGSAFSQLGVPVVYDDDDDEESDSDEEVYLLSDGRATPSEDESCSDLDDEERMLLEAENEQQSAFSKAASSAEASSNFCGGSRKKKRLGKDGQKTKKGASSSGDAGWVHVELPVVVRDCVKLCGENAWKARHSPKVEDALNCFFPECVWTLMVESTNYYAAQLRASDKTEGPHVCSQNIKRNWRDTSVQEMKQFIGLLLVFGTHRQPNLRCYWQTETCSNGDFVRSIMKYQRFVDILRCWNCVKHFNIDPVAGEADVLSKVRPLLDMYNDIFRKSYTPEPDLAMDEAMVQQASRWCRIRQINCNKPGVGDAIKIITLNESETGYLYQFIVDIRGSASIKSCALSMLSCLEGRYYRVAIDRYYNSVGLVEAALERGIYVYGTVRLDRGVPADLQAFCAANALEDGEYVWRMRPDQTFVCTWRDSGQKGHCFVSNMHSSTATTILRRKKAVGVIEKNAPLVAKVYNENMGGADLGNRMHRVYGMPLKGNRKWYKSLIRWVIDVATVNAYLWYKRGCVEGSKHMSHLEFHRELASILCGSQSSSRMSARFGRRNVALGRPSNRPLQNASSFSCAQALCSPTLRCL